MKIYDFETFKKNCKNIKAVKFKGFEDLPKDFFYYGKKVNADYVFMFYTSIWLNIFYENKRTATISINETTFNRNIEYVEIDIGLEI
jgi:hypothetical protein